MTKLVSGKSSRFKLSPDMRLAYSFDEGERRDRMTAARARLEQLIDWDAALVIDEKKNFDETLYAMELANLQLAELEAYDRILDDALERSYRDLGRQAARRPPLRSTRSSSGERSANPSTHIQALRHRHATALSDPGTRLARLRVFLQSGTAGQTPLCKDRRRTAFAVHRGPGRRRLNSH
jgi:hypothetical protein